MTTEYIATEIQENIGIITLNNSKALNSINKKMITELASEIDKLNNLNDIRVIVLKGIEKSFAAGIDIKELANNISDAGNIIKSMQYCFNSIVNSEKPIIAVVSGFALGIGCEIALACDIILATDTAKFGLPELSVGLLPCFGGCSMLMNNIGRAKMMDMLLTGKAMSADDAEKSGLISRVITESSMVEEYTKIAQRIAMLPQNSVTTAKKSVAALSLNQGINMEKLICLSHIESGDFKQTLKNFAQKASSDR